jgi:hypothetical protein
MLKAYWLAGRLLQGFPELSSMAGDDFGIRMRVGYLLTDFSN